MRILGRPASINVRKVLWTADEAGLDYAHEPQWGTPNAPAGAPDFRRINPNALVPALIDENGVLWESNTICRYLAGFAGRDDLLPCAPAPRARVEMWMDWQATELNTAWRYAFMALVRRDPAYADPTEVERSAKRWNELMLLLDRRLDETGAYVAGDAFTLADIVVGLSAHRWRATPINHAPAPAVAAWLSKLGTRPAFQRWTNYP